MSHELLMEQLKAQGKKIYRQSTVRDYQIAILEIYNYGLRAGKGRIAFSL